MRFRTASSVVLVPILAVPACSHSALSSSEWPLVVERIVSPAVPGSGQPQLSVSDRGVLLSWIERGEPRATLKFAERTASGWSQPRAAASGDDWFVNWADVPSVLRLADGTLAAHWLQKSGPDTYAYDVRLSWSKDDGKTWSPSFTPHHDGTQTEHGFASLFQMPGAGLGLVWLDGRGMKPEHHESSGDMSVRAAVFDGGWKQLAEMEVDLRVCECCPTTVAVTSEGPIAAFRDRSAAEVRDISVSRLEQGKWTEPAPVHADGWTIPACPVNGPMLGARGRDVAIGWFTVKENQGHAYVAFSNDAGRSFSAPIRIDDGGSLGRVDIELMLDGSAIASWIEFADERAQFRVRRVAPDGSKSAAITVSGIAGNRTSGYPRIARHGDELVFAWTESDPSAGLRAGPSTGGGLRVHTAVARLPVAATN
jgi:hypothetical protein